MPIEPGQQILASDVNEALQQAMLNAVDNAVDTGQYTGDGTTNRAIAHNLGRIPQMIFIFCESYSYITVNGQIYNTKNRSFYPSDATVSPWTDTHFYVTYVGNVRFNQSGYTYRWVAI